MTKFLLSIHVLAAIIAIGPVTVAASMFPAAARRAAESDTDSDRAAVATLHRICRVYSGIGIAVPIFGFATASSLGVLGQEWLLVSIALTAAAAAILGLRILPRQTVLSGTTKLSGTTNTTTTGQWQLDERTAAQLTMYTGVFNMLWVVVTILMIMRPGSTTGA